MLRLPYWNRILACIPKSPKGFSENMEIRIWKAFSQLQLSPSLQPREALSQSMIINDNQRQSMTINDNQWCGTSDTSDTSHTANSSDASKASASVTRLLSYLLLPLCYIYGKQCWPISFNQFSNNRNFCRRWFLVTPHKEATKTIGIFKAHLGLQMSLHIICFIAFLFFFSAKNGYQKKN